MAARFRLREHASGHRERWMQRTIDKCPVTRCAWADGDPPMQAYHDHEWGVPARGELGMVVDTRVQVDDSPHVSGVETVVRHVTTPIAGT
ncbi:TPA: hypothetical protein QDC55_003866 [Burkholderia cenocepacia]|nr:hypothetical protein [Burkholderia cenocepacia]HDR9811613.1 hypothetical protein [Burkholderia cenocepacia]HDR9818376.1 hypothetical protein [Burkholderia cenocepacia]HDR9830293.1 hypothetical protein [Burkholderia cenocepacia]